MKRRSKFSYLMIPAILFLVALFLLSGVKLLEALWIPRGEVQEQVKTKTIVRDGISYYPRQDINVILLIGTDVEGKIQSSGSYNNKASADMVALLIFDEATEEFRVLSLNRDTMMDIPVLGLNGRQAGTVYAQLATSHNYGTGLSDSCENTRKAVSDFLYGITIDHYFSMNMDGIGILNDSVGGVQVRIEDDFSQVDTTLVQGTTMVLNGEQAYSFVRSRASVGSKLNISRMERQRQYMEGFVTSLQRTLETNSLFFAELWSDISDYAITDCSTVVLNRLAADYGQYRFAGSLTPEGDNVLADKYYEFYPDEALLDELILELFYHQISS